jgi:hypothetical protein
MYTNTSHHTQIDQIIVNIFKEVLWFFVGVTSHWELTIVQRNSPFLIAVAHQRFPPRVPGRGLDLGPCIACGRQAC